MDDVNFPGWQLPRSIQIVEGDAITRVLVKGQLYMSWPSGDEGCLRLAMVQLYHCKLGTQEELAAAFGRHVNSVQRYVTDFAKEGIRGLVSERRGPKGHWKVTPELRGKILWIVLRQGIWELEAIQQRLMGAWHEVVSVPSIQQVLAENGLGEPIVPGDDAGMVQGELFGPEPEKQLTLNLDSGISRSEAGRVKTSGLEAGKEVGEAQAPGGRTGVWEKESRRNYSPAQRVYLDRLEQGEDNAYVGGLLLTPLLARYRFLPTLRQVIPIRTHEGYSLEELGLTLFYLDLFGFRSLEDFKRAYPEEFGVLVGRTQSPSLFTLRRFLHQVRELGKGEVLIEAFAQSYLQTGLAQWGVMYIDGHFMPYYGMYPITKGWHGVRQVAMKGSYNFLVVDERFTPWLFLIRSSSEDLLQKIPELIEKAKRLGEQAGVSRERLDKLIVVFDREGYPGYFIPRLNKEVAGASEGLKTRGPMTMTPATSSSTDCKNQPLLFQDLGSRQVVSDFSGGTLSSDGGALLLRQVDRGLGVMRSLARCFYDLRNSDFVDHQLEQLLAQRIYGIALGYEDVNDHEWLRLDPLLAAACEKLDPLGQDRKRAEFRGAALAAPSTLNRLELSNNKDTQAHKLPHDPKKVEACLLEMGVRCLPKDAREIVLDLDAMGHLLHGLQEGRYFNAYYNDYCYLPLYVMAGDTLLWAELRTAEHGAAHGVVRALEQIVPAIRKRCPQARITVRGDAGFGNDQILSWCEGQPEVYYCIGVGKTSVLIEKLQPALAQARARHCLVGSATRAFAEFQHETVSGTWSRSRRVIGKAEVSVQGDNPRFVVTNLPAEGFEDDEEPDRFTPAHLYEVIYCARGECENVLKQQVLDLQADRMSTHHLASNQLRLWFSAFAYMLVDRVRTIGCQGTELARATAGSIRLKLFKVAAQVKVSVRRVYVQLSTAYPLQNLFRLCQERLSRLAVATG